MITFTKEQLIASAHARIEFAEMMLAGELEPLKERTWSIELELARIALASLEAEPVAFRSKLQPPSAIGSERWDYTDHRQPDAFELENCVIERLYTAPPAPVSDSLLSELLGIAKRAAYEADECAHAEFSDDSMEHSAAIADWERRAAMLQGAENAETPTTMQTAPTLDSSPKIAESPTGINQGKSEPVTTANKLPFDQWLSQQTGTIDVECGCVMTEVFFHWLRVAYEAGNSPVIQDGWVACVERMPSAGEQVLAYRPDAPESNDPLIKMATYVGGSAHGHGFDCYCKPTHWMPLPAAPQQEA
ncbi:DUF551 domain-containing protein [Enterobacter hormaechei]|uniref:DUF551 domain-containing protein n=1 Tax=Enterobacter hormaechei TaxID=158836 RepID=UPI0003BE8B03|nr:DUF551 domain-containing protein [Enterobacter hormaechei]ESL77631.1 hypothetical protein L422_03927 [Enterobacter hormaechei]